MKSTKLLHFFTFFFVMYLSFSVCAQDQVVEYTDAWSKKEFNLISQEKGSVTIQNSIQKFIIAPTEIKGEEMINIVKPGSFLPNDAGAPNLAGDARYIAIPQGANPVLTIKNIRTEIIKDLNIAPAPVIPLDTDKGEMKFEKNKKIYEKNAFYPAQPIKLSNKTQVRGVDVVMLGITPFQYNPVTKELKVIRDVEVEISFQGGSGQFGEERLRSRWWDPILQDMLLNYESLPKIDYSKRIRENAGKEVGAEYLIITPTDVEFLQWADSIKKFRVEQGITTKIVTLTEVGGNTPTALETYIDNAYSTWTIPPAAVMLLGDYGSSSNNSVTSPIYNNYCASDNILADYNSNQLPDMVFARMTAQNATQLETMITKFLDYERTPPTTAGYYNNPITACGWQTERWFQICSESVYGFWAQLGKTPVRQNAIYSGTPGSTWSTTTYGNTSAVVALFSDTLGYIPPTPSGINWTGGSATGVTNAINSGAFMMQHRDHGFESGWGEPDFTSTHISNLTNDDLIWVFSINCLTGKYNISSECFAEKFHRYKYNGQNSGALGITAASEVSYSFVNDTYVWGMFDNMWPNFMPSYGTNPPSRDILPAFGNAAGKIFLEQSGWPYNTNNKEVTYHLFHHHGDAFTTVYTEMPQNLTVNHDPVLFAGLTSFDIQADNGAFIALTVGGEIIGTATANGSFQSIAIDPQLPPNQVLVTVTKQNYYRYSALIDVIPPAGPYVVYNDYLINDPTGNADGILDYGEDVSLDFTVENVGVEIANNVDLTIRSVDPYITISDSIETYGTVDTLGVFTINNAFALSVADSVPDQHMINFEVEATDGDSIWMSYFSLKAHAPLLEYVEFSIADPNGNGNNKLDPGETVTMTVKVTNLGSSDAYNVTGLLSSADSYINIVETSPQQFGNVSSADTAAQTFTVIASPSTPAGHSAEFMLNIAANAGIESSGVFNTIIGQIPVLIIGLDGNNNSGPEMQTAVQNNGVTAELMTSFPGNLNLYSSVFVCLGMYGSSGGGNHELTSAEGQALADYLNNGGNVYMEGGDTWFYDDQTTVHPMFNIDGVADGTSNLSTLAGQTGTFTDGMSFSYTGDNAYADHINPIAPAVKIFQNQSPSYGAGVAYDQGSYKTIGTSFEFGGLVDGASPSTLDELMMEYLIFFGIVPDGLTADFVADQNYICVSEQVQFTDVSWGNAISWAWSFEGGDPATSTDQNPLVSYNTSGVYEVELIIDDGASTDTITKTNYINVFDVPTQPSIPDGPVGVCEGEQDILFTTESLSGAQEYIWTIYPENAGSITLDDTTALVDLNVGFTGSFYIKVKGRNISCAGDFSDSLEVSISATPEVPVVTRHLMTLTSSAEVGNQWYDDNGIIDGATEQTYQVPENGNFYTIVTIDGCSSDMSNVMEVVNFSIEDLDDFGTLHVYPNPNTGEFYVELPNTMKNALMTISSVEGQIVYTKQIEQHETIHVDLEMPKGLYFIELIGNDRVFRKKVIIY